MVNKIYTLKNWKKSIIDLNLKYLPHIVLNKNAYLLIITLLFSKFQLIDDNFLFILILYIICLNFIIIYQFLSKQKMPLIDYYIFWINLIIIY